MLAGYRTIWGRIIYDLYWQAGWVSSLSQTMHKIIPSIRRYSCMLNPIEAAPLSLFHKQEDSVSIKTLEQSCINLDRHYIQVAAKFVCRGSSWSCRGRISPTCAGYKGIVIRNLQQAIQERLTIFLDHAIVKQCYNVDTSHLLHKTKTL